MRPPVPQSRIPDPHRVPEPVLSVEQLSVSIGGRPVVEDVSLEVAPGGMLGLVGESGCGKTITALSIMRLVPEPPGKVTGRRIALEGENLLTLRADELRRVRGGRVAMIFQEPMSSLNPVFTIGDQISEAVLLHQYVSRAAARARAAELLGQVGIAAPERQLRRYPHELSGGQRQRVMIAMALANDPALLIADEPTTALDVTIQAQILELIDRLRRERGMAVLLITHDLGVVAEYCDRVAVMYAGRIVEEGTSEDILERPRHRYTEALLRTIPALNMAGATLPSIPGSVPEPGAGRWDGCAYLPRCGAAIDACSTRPELDQSMHPVRCWNPAA
jgi:oligopeptide/dipeptide ABC transporter ATP-binding protein